MNAQRTTLITGGVGFVGSNLARRLRDDGERVILLDNLSGPSAEMNFEQQTAVVDPRCEVRIADVRDRGAVRDAVAEASTVFHFAAHVGAASPSDAALEFEVNAQGTLNVLEALREMPKPPPLVFASTHEVYGALADLAVQRCDARFAPLDADVARYGISETQPLAFQSTHGCSKGTADQYVQTYARRFGLSTVVLRMSSVYGPGQTGMDEREWLAHVVRRALGDGSVTVHGDGHQVRDVLFVTDLVDALVLARDQMASLRGMAFNLGGGPEQTLTAFELVRVIAEAERREPPVVFERARPHEPRFYASDNRRFATRTGWAPKITLREGVRRFSSWMRDAGLVPREPATMATMATMNVVRNAGTSAY